MSNRAHSGRCFRAWRRTTHRKRAQGKEWVRPVRFKVPDALRAFVGDAKRADMQTMNIAIRQYARHQIQTGARPQRIGARGQ